jgi:hypothetical protein
MRKNVSVVCLEEDNPSLPLSVAPAALLYVPAVASCGGGGGDGSGRGRSRPVFILCQGDGERVVRLSARAETKDRPEGFDTCR